MFYKIIFSKLKRLTFFLLFAFISTRLCTVLEIFLNNELSLVRTETVDFVVLKGSIKKRDYERYVTFGRPQGSCTLKFNNAIIDTNRSSIGERSKLFIGSVIEKDKDGTLELNCLKLTGSPVRFPHSGFLTSYRTAKFLEIVRFLNDQVLPYFIILFLSIILINHEIKNYKFPKIFTIAAIISSWSAYLSLSNVPRLFLDNLTSFKINVISQITFTTVTTCWITSNTIIRRAGFIWWICNLILFGFLFQYRQELVFKTYIYIYYTSHLLVLIVACLLPLSVIKVPQTWLKSSLLLLFSILIASDYLFHLSGRSSFFAPMAIITIFGVTGLEYLRSEKSRISAQETISQAALIQAGQLSQVEKIQAIVQLVSEKLKLDRWSIFIDSYALGLSDRAGLELRRIATSSQDQKDTTESRGDNPLRLYEDVVVSLDENVSHGSFMKSALRTGKPVLDLGQKDQKIFSIIPIGQQGVLNFTTSKGKKFDYEFIENFINELSIKLETILLSILRSEKNLKVGDTLLRQHFGPGTHTTDLGVIFADVVGYTQNIKKSDQFLDFFQLEYVPTLMKSLGRSVALKEFFGDELFLVVYQSEEPQNIYQSTLDVLHRFDEFVRNEGSKLCAAAGFDPIEFRIGAHAGPSTLKITGKDIGIHGPVIEGKRAQTRARPSQPFISEQLYQYLSENEKSSAQHEVYAAKKEILEGYRIVKKKIAS